MENWKDEIIKTLSEAINVCDRHGETGMGDKLYEAIITLSNEWDLEE